MNSFQLRHFKNLWFFHNTHANYEVVWVTKGCLVVCVNGKDIPVRSGQAIFLPPYFVHAFRTDDSSESHIFEFTAELVTEKLPNDIVLFELSDKADKILHKVKNKDNIFAHKAAVYHILSVMNNDYVKKLPTSSGDVCLEAVKFIADNYSQPITLRDAANHLCVNYSHLSRSFKKCIGLSFTDCLNGTRLNRAAGLLARTGTSITDISLICGFGSVRNFNRIFLKNFDCSPYEFRKKQKY